MLHKLGIAAICACLLAAFAAAETVYTTRTNNPLREGAGAYYTLIVAVPENTALVVVERAGSWIKVQLPDKRVGWVAANCIAERKNDRVPTKSLNNVWSSPKASKAGITAAIKGFGKKYGKSEPGNVEMILRYSEKGFTGDEFASFNGALQQGNSVNKNKLQLEDLKLVNPEYYTTLQEQEIGVGIGARIAGNGIVDNKALHKYINLVCAVIAANSMIYDWDLTVIIIRDNKVNSFALPGGYIFITTGALQLCKDESELAGIIAHEIAHVYRRHGLQEMSKRIVKIHSDEAFSELDEEVGEKSDDEKEMEDLTDQMYEKVVHPRLLAYELEADKVGAVLMANAGYDPFGLVRISERFARIPSEKPDIFDPEYMLPDDAAVRSKEIRAFVTENFSPSPSQEQLDRRFNAALKTVR